jgi:AcrR family transcriptional regulator
VAEPGLRERKKQQTRQLILDTASRLFVERGVDGVTVTEIARAAELSEMTVFNYFATKEDLVFGRMEFFEEQLVAAVEQRAPEESAVAAFGRMLLAGIDQLATRRENDRQGCNADPGQPRVAGPGARNHSALHSPACRRIPRRNFEHPTTLAITLIGIRSDRYSRRISAQSSTLNTHFLLTSTRGQHHGGQFSNAAKGQFSRAVDTRSCCSNGAKRPTTG